LKGVTRRSRYSKGGDGFWSSLTRYEKKKNVRKFWFVKLGKRDRMLTGVVLSSWRVYGSQEEKKTKKAREGDKCVCLEGFAQKGGHRMRRDPPIALSWRRRKPGKGPPRWRGGKNT